MTLSFNDNLESILELKNKHELYQDFILYLKQTYCLENVLFYQDVQEYQYKPTKSRYKAIIERYILVNSTQEINIPCEMRQDLINNQIYVKSSFDQATESILELIRVNSYLPWWYQHHHHHHHPTSYRNSLTPSMSVPEHRWQNLFTSRPSFTSLRDVKCVEQKEKKNNLFQRKRQALMIRVKKTFL